MLKPSLCYSSDAYILFKGSITIVENREGGKQTAQQRATGTTDRNN